MVLTPKYHVIDPYQGTRTPPRCRWTCDPTATRSRRVYSDRLGLRVPQCRRRRPSDHEQPRPLSIARSRHRDPRLGMGDANGSEVSGRILTADTMQAHDAFDDPHAVRIASFDDARYAGGMLRPRPWALSDRQSGGNGD